MVLAASFFVMLAAVGAPADEPGSRPASPQEAEFFETRIRPVLAGRCVRCHGPGTQESNLRLDSRAALLAGGDAGPVATPGDPEDSPLIEAIRYDGPVRMPPKGKLPAAAVADLVAWVRMGLPWPESPPRAAVASSDDVRRNHWAFRPVVRPGVPAVRDPGWPRSAIDGSSWRSWRGRGCRPRRRRAGGR
jgi:mono/diheme cytochrome c family protein